MGDEAPPPRGAGVAAGGEGATIRSGPVERARAWGLGGSSRRGGAVAVAVGAAAVSAGRPSSPPPPPCAAGAAAPRSRARSCTGCSGASPRPHTPTCSSGSTAGTTRPCSGSPPTSSSSSPSTTSAPSSTTLTSSGGIRDQPLPERPLRDGGRAPGTAQAMVTLPFAAPDKVEQDLFDLLSGVTEGLAEAGAVLVGGHTAEGPECALGLTVNGLCDRPMLKAGAADGDRLLLTKPLGTGVVFAADMRAEAPSEAVEAAIASMLRSNEAAARIFREHEATSCTDVTGFGLLGHLVEMLRGGRGWTRSSTSPPSPRLPGGRCARRAGIPQLSPRRERRVRHRAPRARPGRPAGRPPHRPADLGRAPRGRPRRPGGGVRGGARGRGRRGDGDDRHVPRGGARRKGERPGLVSCHSSNVGYIRFGIRRSGWSEA